MSDIELVERALVAAIDFDFDAAADALGDLAELEGERGIYGAASGFAAVITAEQIRREGRGGWYLEIANILTGEQVDEATTPREAEALWIGRFVTAAANRDQDMMFALWCAVREDPETAMERVCALLSLAAQAARAMHGSK